MRVVLLALALLLTPAVASAQITVLSSTDHGTSSELLVDGDLGIATAMLTENADAQLRAAAPQLYAPIDLGLARYSETTTVVDAITWRRVSDTELGVTVRAHVRALQEHRTLSLAWARDGVVTLANVTLEARATASFTASGSVHVVVLGDSVSIAPQVAGLSALGAQAVPLNGRQLGEQTIDGNPLASRHQRGTAIVITSVEGTTVHSRVTAVPAS
jgi:hypothetical protein